LNSSFGSEYFLGIAMKALPASHKAILPDQSMWVSTTRTIVFGVRVPNVGEDIILGFLNITSLYVCVSFPVRGCFFSVYM